MDLFGYLKSGILIGMLISEISQTVRGKGSCASGMGHSPKVFLAILESELRYSRDSCEEMQRNKN